MLYICGCMISVRSQSDPRNIVVLITRSISLAAERPQQAITKKSPAPEERMANEVKGQGPAILGGFQQADPKRSEYLEMMRFFEEAGARDKDSMITIVTWLLAFAAVIIGF